MAGNPKEKRWAFYSVAILFAFSVSDSVSGQGTGTSVGSLNDAVEIQRSDSMAEEMGHEPGSVPTGHASTPTGPLSGAQDNVAGGAPKELTAFFTIGFIVNILVIGAFTYWAVGQWRKTK